MTDTPEKRDAWRIRRTEEARKRRANMTPEQRKELNQKARSRAKVRRASQPPEKRRHDRQENNNRRAIRSLISQGYTITPPDHSDLSLSSIQPHGPMG